MEGNESLRHIFKNQFWEYNVKWKTLKSVKRNSIKYVYDVRVVKDFLKQTYKTLTLNKGKTYIWVFFKTRASDDQQELKSSKKRSHNLGKDVCIWLKSSMYSANDSH